MIRISARTRIGAATIALVLLAALPTSAQSAAEAPSLAPRRIVIGLAGAWLGADELGGVRAETRGNAIGTASPPPFTLFDTRSQLDHGIGAVVTVLVPITPRWAIEGRGAFRRPTLTTTITGDAEAPGTFTATERVAEYEAGGSLVYHPAWPRLGTRIRPYVLGGVSYLRQLHDDDAVVETGTAVHVGGGARLWLSGAGGGLATGVTGDVRWVARRRAITFATGTRSLPAASLGVFVAF